MVLTILKNPTYAGAFAYGRHRTRTKVVDGRVRKSSGHEEPRESWQVLILDHHPGYISWQEYLDNQEQLSSNVAMKGRMNRGAVREGEALLAGLLRCARCSRKLHVAYSGSQQNVIRYHCRGANLNHGRAPCISFAGRKVDEAISQAVLEAITPAGLEAAQLAWREQGQANSEASHSLELALERAQYEVDRARRQFDRVEPENRLVAAELERRWEEALRQQQEAATRLNEAALPVDELGEEDHRRLLELGTDLRQAWDHPAASFSVKKRILRTVVEEVVADLDETSTYIKLKIHWSGGVHTKLEVRKNRPGKHRHCTDRKVVDLLWLTLQEAAEILEISQASTRRLIRQGILPGEQVVPHAPWVIERANLTLTEVRSAVAAIHQGRKPPSRDSRQIQIPLKSTT